MARQFDQGGSFSLVKSHGIGRLQNQFFFFAQDGQTFWSMGQCIWFYFQNWDAIYLYFYLFFINTSSVNIKKPWEIIIISLCLLSGSCVGCIFEVRTETKFSRVISYISPKAEKNAYFWNIGTRITHFYKYIIFYGYDRRRCE